MSERKCIPAFIVSFLLATPVAADIVYRPINPSFGGDSFNSSHLNTLATAQNLHKPKPASKTQSSTERFLAMLQSRLYSALASQVAEAIFGDNAQKEGTVTFDDQQVHFANDGTEIQISITNLLNGEVTTIVVPVLQEQ